MTVTVQIHAATEQDYERVAKRLIAEGWEETHKENIDMPHGQMIVCAEMARKV